MTETLNNNNSLNDSRKRKHDESSNGEDSRKRPNLNNSSSSSSDSSDESSSDESDGSHVNAQVAGEVGVVNESSNYQVGISQSGVGGDSQSNLDPQSSEASQSPIGAGADAVIDEIAGNPDHFVQYYSIYDDTE